MPDRIAWFNDRLVDINDPCISLMDRGMLYGDGLFETLRVYTGQLFRLEAHRNRLCRAAEKLRIPLPTGLERLSATIQAVCKANNRLEGAVRVTLTRGIALSGLDPEPNQPPTLQITTAPLRDGLDQSMHLVPVALRRDETSPLSQIKSLNYLPNILARFEVKEHEADEGLLLNTEGYIAEGTISNVFWIKDGVLYTPSPDCGILSGIAREVVIESAHAMGIQVIEGKFPLSALEEAQGIFMTNSLIEIVPVIMFDDRPCPYGTIPMITQLQAAYQQAVRDEIRR
jgi:branched-chain amino acid aminotransferase